MVNQNIDEMADEAYNLTVVDVYDAAAVIGKDFEVLIDNYGADAVTELMPKVIKILEHLEFLATRNEKENTDVAELKLVVERLEAAKADRVLEREKYEKELEQIEDTWRQEVKELLTVVAKLQEDNRKLNNAVKEKEGQAARIEKNEEEEARVMTRLKDTVDSQRAQIKEMDRKLRQQAVDMEAMQLQLEKIARQNVEARHQSSAAKTQSQQLLVEKAELETQIQEREQQIAHISDTIERHEKAADLHVQPSPYPMQGQINRITKVNREIRRKTNVTRRQAQILVQEKSDLQTQLHERHLEVEEMKGSLHQQKSTEDGICAPLSPSTPTDDMDNIEEKLHNLGKMVVDLKDPNRPRFTMSELREVLLERNELKTKLLEVEEELKIYKVKSDTDKEVEEQCLPVHGPINREPIEKLYPGYKEESGIKRFFKSFFGTSQKKGSDVSRHQRRRNSQRGRASSMYDSLSISQTVQGRNIKLNQVSSQQGLRHVPTGGRDPNVSQQDCAPNVPTGGYGLSAALDIANEPLCDLNELTQL